MEVRRARLDDVRDITEVHCSNERWDVPYQDLSIDDRTRRGGPWMSVETCAIHIHQLLAAGHHSLVAVEGERVVGELELYIGPDLPDLGKMAEISVLYVHRDHQRQGVGTTLVEAARNIARAHGCQRLLVTGPQVEVFYQHCGLTFAFNLLIKEVEPQANPVSFCWQPVEEPASGHLWVGRVLHPTQIRYLIFHERISARAQLEAIHMGVGFRLFPDDPADVFFRAPWVYVWCRRLRPALAPAVDSLAAQVGITRLLYALPESAASLVSGKCTKTRRVMAQSL